jgi:transcriptional regulator with XRE-family HTH domain
MTDLTKFGINLKVIRVQAGLTQESLAIAAGLDRSYIGELERGQRNPSLEVLLKLARALGCSLDDFVRDMY